MRVLLATAAALVFATAPAAPSQAQNWGGHGFSAHHGDRISWGGDHDRRRHRDFRGDIVVGAWGYDDWGRYNNRSFDHDSYNDWWHERPNRSYPRWVTNGKCDRLWWGGGQWRCTW